MLPSWGHVKKRNSYHKVSLGNLPWSIKKAGEQQGEESQPTHLAGKMLQYELIFIKKVCETAGGRTETLQMERAVVGRRQQRDPVLQVRAVEEQQMHLPCHLGGSVYCRLGVTTNVYGHSGCGGVSFGFSTWKPLKTIGKNLTTVSYLGTRSDAPADQRPKKNQGEGAFSFLKKVNLLATKTTDVERK